MTVSAFAPFYRSTIGFDRLAQIFDNVRTEAQQSYPPYNIELVDENKYRITMAIAGFNRSDLEIETERDTLRITGRKQADTQQRNFLHRGIATRNFEHRFQLADHVHVVAAFFDQGILNIDLIREVPESLKPRKIYINTTKNTDRIE